MIASFLNIYTIPVLVGAIYWLIHKLRGRLDERSLYRRKRLFGVLTLSISSLLLLMILFLLSNEPSSPSALGRSFFWTLLGLSTGWGWIRLLWTSYDQWEEEREKLGHRSPQTLFQAIGLWLSQLRKLLKLEKPALKPYQYSQQSPSQKSSKPKDSTPLDPMEEELLRYQDLLSRGVITNKEYDEMRRKTLGL